MQGLFELEQKVVEAHLHPLHALVKLLPHPASRASSRAFRPCRFCWRSWLRWCIRSKACCTTAGGGASGCWFSELEGVAAKFSACRAIAVRWPSLRFVAAAVNVSMSCCRGCGRPGAGDFQQIVTDLQQCCAQYWRFLSLVRADGPVRPAVAGLSISARLALTATPLADAIHTRLQQVVQSLFEPAGLSGSDEAGLCASSG